ncbi:M28 family metallopeptidase [Nocardioides sp. T2.26MG-1]|uniref:M28 family metallopeptidase n=1 Tax=Nocardioides sp. T2.26MG-1 TaxID=3041166 RepID=UPI00247754CF|nr:M28 family peptidase [Nocardioides sp. T2.26MG-1]CAI9405975.1 hypothetical protein HIDPHFAB_04492 [Nocardioides sp. T2.26MG-1]
MRGALAALAVVLTAAACTADPVDPRSPPVTTPPTSTAPTDPATSTGPPVAAPRFDADRALATVRDLATGIGPRLATRPAYGAAVALLWPRLVSSGYAVTRQSFAVPAGDSWGVPARAGRSSNVVAVPPDFDPDRPYAIVGAHLDTVAVAPGAEDNASGVAVVMELARTLDSDSDNDLPVVLVLFGGEEPRGPGDLHHFGSKHYVAQLSAQERRSLVAMVSLDRVGVGRTVPLYSVDGGPTEVRDQLERAGRRTGVPTTVGTNTGSDHESFADAGLPAARVGGTSYAAYHSADDRPDVVDRAQLARVGRLLTAWIAGLPRGR